VKATYAMFGNNYARRVPLEYTVEQADDLWKAAVNAFGYDGPFHLQVADDTPQTTLEILRARGFTVSFNGFQPINFPSASRT
jgi:hypothetical protein